MGLDTVSTEIYAIYGYFCGLTVGQRTPRFLGCHTGYDQCSLIRTGLISKKDTKVDCHH